MASATGGSRLLVVAWARFQPRTNALGPALGGESFHINGAWPGRQLALLPLRYLANTMRMWRLLRRRRPRVLVVVTPPVVAPAIAWLWCLTHRCLLVADCHTAGFHWSKWRWSVPIHRLLFHRAAAVLVHTRDDEVMVRGWGFRSLLLPDDLPGPEEADVPARAPGRLRLLVAGSFDPDEPVAAALSAARLLPEVEIRFTGNAKRLPESMVSSAPENVVFCGYLPYRRFLGEMMAADAVAVFSTDGTAMNRAAFEAVGLGRPLILSDVPGLRGRFEEAAAFCENDPATMAEAVRHTLRQRVEQAAKTRALRAGLQAQRDAAIEQLQVILKRTPRQLRPVEKAGSLP
jgi:glycosyltransferase involved in cell wall biosynthesis